jgi:hypothetical protein
MAGRPVGEASCFLRNPPNARIKGPTLPATRPRPP